MLKMRHCRVFEYCFVPGDGFQFYTELMRLARTYGNTMDEAFVQIHYGGALTNIKVIFLFFYKFIKCSNL